jgi:hypothetical protein
MIAPPCASIGQPSQISAAPQTKIADRTTVFLQ